MLMYLSFVPPGSGEAEYTIPFDLPYVPRPGDSIAVDRDAAGIGYETFVVRSASWLLLTPNDRRIAKGEVGKAWKLFVECEFVRSPGMNSDAHATMCDQLETRGFQIQPMGYGAVQAFRPPEV